MKLIFFGKPQNTQNWHLNYFGWRLMKPLKDRFPSQVNEDIHKIFLTACFLSLCVANYVMTLEHCAWGDPEITVKLSYFIYRQLQIWVSLAEWVLWVGAAACFIECHSDCQILTRRDFITSLWCVRWSIADLQAGNLKNFCSICFYPDSTVVTIR